MARLLLAERFVDDSASLHSPRLLKRLRLVLDMIQSFPESGTGNVPRSIAEEFGGRVRLCPLNPFDLVYEYDEDADTVMVYGLVPQRAIF